MTKGRPLLRYQTYTGQNSSGAWKSENQPSGDLDGQLGVQGIRLDFTKPFHEVYYSVYCGGWSKEVSTAQIAGTPGKSIEGLRIRLDEDGAKDFDISYRVHTLDGAWSLWTKNGEELLTSNSKINAVQIKLISKQK